MANHQGDTPETDSFTTGRALVAAPSGAKLGDGRGLPGFVTQLIACARRLPAYRKARQAEPVSAANAYGSRHMRMAGRMDVTV